MFEVMSYPIVNIDDITPKHLASICDHTFLNRSEAYRASGVNAVITRAKEFDAFLKETKRLVETGRQPYALCVRPEDVSRTVGYLSNNNLDIVVASVVGFPDGSLYSTDFKTAETELAINYGAREIDMVLDYNSLKAGNGYLTYHDIAKVVETAHNGGALVKVILETSELNSEQIKKACSISTLAKADFVKTSTGFSSEGANKMNLMIMRSQFKGGLKASGGIGPSNVKDILFGLSGRMDYKIKLDPMEVRIGEGSLLSKI